MKHLKQLFGLLASSLFLFLSCSTRQQAGQHNSASNRNDTLRLAFYNVENLFDTSDDPKTQDEDFTPGGKLQWSEKRFELKLQHLAAAVQSIDPNWPDVIGMCEIENNYVLNQLISRTGMNKAGYAIVHQDSPDERGIDVALLYKKALIKLEKFEYMAIPLPADNDRPTRDILYALFQCRGERIHVLVNHWPSRSSGEQVSEPRRLAAARVLRKKIDTIQAQDARAKIIVMGDFNDYPANQSVRQVLGAGPDQTDVLFNAMFQLDLEGHGTYWYKGDWGTLDQFMVSWPLLKASNGWTAGKQSARIHRNELLLFTDDKGEQRPNRTYAGENYTGGYSDHLPVSFTLVFR